MRDSSYGRVVRCGGVLLAGLVVGPAGLAGAPVYNAGPGTSVAQDGLDTPNNGPRLNIDRSAPIALPAGTYQATTFEYAAGQGGDVTPLLVFSPANNFDYTVLAVGASVNVPGAGVGEVFFGGSDTFTLAAPTTVYAGITNSNASPQNPIFYDQGVFSTTHSQPLLDADRFTVGGVLEGNNSVWTLNRVYAFTVAVNTVPEPASVALLAAPGLAMLARRRRD